LPQKNLNLILQPAEEQEPMDTLEIENVEFHSLGDLSGRQVSLDKDAVQETKEKDSVKFIHQVTTRSEK